MAYLKGGSIIDGNFYVEGGLRVKRITDASGKTLPHLFDANSSVKDRLIKFVDKDGAITKSLVSEKLNADNIPVYSIMSALEDIEVNEVKLHLNDNSVMSIALDKSSGIVVKVYPYKNGEVQEAREFKLNSDAYIIPYSAKESSFSLESELFGIDASGYEADAFEIPEEFTYSIAEDKRAYKFNVFRNPESPYEKAGIKELFYRFRKNGIETDWIRSEVDLDTSCKFGYTFDWYATSLDYYTFKGIDGKGTSIDNPFTGVMSYEGYSQIIEAEIAVATMTLKKGEGIKTIVYRVDGVTTESTEDVNKKVHNGSSFLWYALPDEDHYYEDYTRDNPYIIDPVTTDFSYEIIGKSNKIPVKITAGDGFDSLVYNANGTGWKFVNGITLETIVRAYNKTDNTFKWYAEVSEGYSFDGPHSEDTAQSIIVTEDNFEKLSNIQLGNAQVNSYSFKIGINSKIDTIYYKINGATTWSSSKTSIDSISEYNKEYSWYAVPKDGYTWAHDSEEHAITGVMGADDYSYTIKDSEISIKSYVFRLTTENKEGIKYLYYRVNDSTDYIKNESLEVNTECLFNTSYAWYVEVEEGYSHPHAGKESQVSGIMEAKDYLAEITEAIPNEYNINLVNFPDLSKIEGPRSYVFSKEDRTISYVNTEESELPGFWKLKVTDKDGNVLESGYKEVDPEGKLSGVYVFNSKLTEFPGGVWSKFNVNFIVKEGPYITRNCDRMSRDRSYLCYKLSGDSTELGAYNYDTESWGAAGTLNVVNFGEEPQTVDVSFWNWVQENAVRQSEKQGEVDTSTIVVKLPASLTEDITINYEFEELLAVDLGISEVPDIKGATEEDLKTRKFLFTDIIGGDIYQSPSKATGGRTKIEANTVVCPLYPATHPFGKVYSSVSDVGVNFLYSWSNGPLDEDYENLSGSTIEFLEENIDHLRTLFGNEGRVWSSSTVYISGVGNVGYYIDLETGETDYTNEITESYFRLSIGTTIPDTRNYLCFTSNEPSSSVSLTMIGTVPDPELETSLNKKTWSKYSINDVITLANAGDKIYWRRRNDTPATSFSVDLSNRLTFEMTGSIAASGNVMSLIDKTCESRVIPNSYCYYTMFNRCTSLTTPPELPATTLTDRCYSYMFNGCTGLIMAPELPAIILDYQCYNSMFYGCSSLTIPPELPATIMSGWCYRYMFKDCINLTTPPELPATSLAETCYCNMFEGCTSLVKAPELPATTLFKSCYGSMFWGCSSLTSAPELPATTMAEGCYNTMFSGCSSLTTPPELPATTLAEGCYGSMFNGCTSLTSAPELPATTLASECYSYMFYNCTNIKLSATQTGYYTIPYRIPTSGTGTTATGWNAYMFANTGGTFTGNPTINTTYYLAENREYLYREGDTCDSITGGYDLEGKVDFNSDNIKMTPMGSGSQSSNLKTKSYIDDYLKSPYKYLCIEYTTINFNKNIGMIDFGIRIPSQGSPIVHENIEPSDTKVLIKLDISSVYDRSNLKFYVDSVSFGVDFNFIIHNVYLAE